MLFLLEFQIEPDGFCKVPVIRKSRDECVSAAHVGFVVQHLPLWWHCSIWQAGRNSPLICSCFLVSSLAVSFSECVLKLYLKTHFFTWQRDNMSFSAFLLNLRVFNRTENGEKWNSVTKDWSKCIVYVNVWVSVWYIWGSFDYFVDVSRFLSVSLSTVNDYGQCWVNASSLCVCLAAKGVTQHSEVVQSMAAVLMRCQ